MNQALAAIQGELQKVILRLKEVVPNDEPFGNAHNNWSFPGLTRPELIEEAQSIIDLIEERGTDEIGDAQPRLHDYVRRLAHLHGQTIPNLWGNAGQAVSAYMLTLAGLRRLLVSVLPSDDGAETAIKLRKLTSQVRGMEARLNGLEPRTASLASMIERIEQAYDAADQLPTDLESLSEARRKLADLVQEATKDQLHLLGVRENADKVDESLRKSTENAEAVLQRCETAYSAATSVGLAAAFNERSDTLATSMWVWVGGLVVALGSGSYFGSERLRALSELFKLPNPSTSVVILNLLLSLLSVGAPVWFAWLATKQIGQRFRLAEDYAFKASISRAYEGFRREAARFDKDMEARLLASALTRLDELPLRLVETDTHGSPWHELFSSDVVKQAIRAVPGFGDQVKDLASKAINAVTSTKDKSTSTPTLPAVNE
ncbi:TPA: hypothetical protein RZC51_004009 [Burkholderia cenocepacia]|nr:hypothetical protein [Burkholderia cenocepacia]